MYKNILISGSLAYDRIMDFPGYFKDHILPDKIHALNVSFLINELKENFGGTAGNIAYNLALLGESPYILASGGADFGNYEKWLRKNKIKIREIRKIRERLTASAYIITDKADNQIAGFNPGAMNESRGKFDGKLLKNSIAIISPGNLRDMEDYAKIYKNKIPYIFDPGQQITVLSKEKLKNGITGAEILIGNDYEIEMIKKKTGWTTDDIIDKVNILIITKGEQGLEIFAKKEKYLIKAAKPKKVLDPTGAGDAYRAGLIKGLKEGWPIEQAAQMGSVVASFAVEKYGGQNHEFTWREMEKRFRKNFGKNL